MRSSWKTTPGEEDEPGAADGGADLVCQTLQPRSLKTRLAFEIDDGLNVVDLADRGRIAARPPRRLAVVAVIVHGDVTIQLSRRHYLMCGKSTASGTDHARRKQGPLDGALTRQKDVSGGRSPPSMGKGGVATQSGSRAMLSDITAIGVPLNHRCAWVPSKQWRHQSCPACSAPKG